MLSGELIWPESQEPRISFGMILLNGEPFLKYSLRALYPYAYEIIVVEGASPAAAGIARPDGHSSDGSLEALSEFRAREDPEGKIQVVIAEDEGYSDGFWPGGKHEQSQAYARRATGNHLWQVDADEFYSQDAMNTVIALLNNEDSVTAVSFRIINFWGSLDYTVDGWYLRRGANEFHRLFKWEPGYEYVSHRPPTVRNSLGQDLRRIRWVRGKEMARKGVYLWHYSLLFPKQVRDKAHYYSHAKWARREQSVQWADNCFLQLKDPFRVHNVYSYPSWLERYRGAHPAAVSEMWTNLLTGSQRFDLRQTEDIEILLESPAYKLKRTALKLLDYPDRLWQVLARAVRYAYRAVHELPA